MADSVVSFLLENLTQLLTQESKVLLGVKDQVMSLKNELFRKPLWRLGDPEGEGDGGLGHRRNHRHG